jgi:Trypsin
MLVGSCVGALLLGQSAPHAGAITNARTADISRYPWIVSVQSAPTDAEPRRFHFCGGALVGDAWVLTAAHCAAADAPPERVVVVVGRNSPTSGDPVGVRRIFRHPRADLMLLQLSSAVAATPIELAAGRADRLAQGDPLRILGWAGDNGCTGQGCQPDALEEAEVRALKNCGRTRGCSNRMHVLLRSSGDVPHAARPGDSGGPVVDSRRGFDRLAGVMVAAGSDTTMAIRMTWVGKWVVDTMRRNTIVVPAGRSVTVAVTADGGVFTKDMTIGLGPEERPMARRVEATSLAPGDSVTLAADDVDRIMVITIRVRDNGRVIRLTDPVYCRIHQEGDDRWIVEFEDADDFDFDEPSLLISLGSTGRRPTSPTPRRHANPPQAPTRT